MTTIDPREAHAFTAAVQAFSAAHSGTALVEDDRYVNLVQAGMRLCRLLGTVGGTGAVTAPTNGTHARAHTTGDFCPCGGMLVRTGTCKTCQSCGHNEGCG